MEDTLSSSRTPAGELTYTIVIRKVARPQMNSINEELQWFGHSLGLFGLRDKDKSCFRVFIELLKAAKLNSAISSDELSYKLGLSRGTVVHHINRLIDSGMVIPTRKKYILREQDLQSLLDMIHKDFEKTYVQLQTIAKDIDERLGL